MLEITATRLPVFMRCNGSIRMPDALPGDDDPTRRDEGTAAHYVAVRMFNGDQPSALIGTKAPNGYVIDADMCQFAAEYLSTLDCGEMESITSHSGQSYRVNGRADHIKWNAANYILTVDEYKYGHRIVDAKMNWTLISHAVGFAAIHGLTPDRIVFRVYQPRAHHHEGPLRIWEIDSIQFNDLRTQMMQTLNNPVDQLTTNPFCATCQSAPICPAYRSAGMNAIDATSAVFNDELSNEALGFELGMLRLASDTIKGRLAAIEELVTYRIKSGAIFEDYGLDPRIGNTRWKPFVTAPLLKALTGIDCAKDDMISPAEAKKRGIPLALLTLYTERPSIAPKLVKIDVDERARKLLKR